MKQRLLTGIIALLVTVCAVAQTTSALPWDGTTTTWTQGAGTQANPYLIENGAHLAYLADKVNTGTTYAGVYFKMVNDIDMDGNPWTPIGTDATNSFRGVFDGDNHSVFDVNMTAGTYLGLFGYTSGATIKNVYADVKIEVLQSISMYIGGLVGYAANTTIDNCHVMGSCAGVVKTAINGMKIYVGGLVGYATSSTIQYSHNYATVMSNDSISITTNNSNTAYTYAGGAAGYAESCTFTYTSNGGSVTAISYAHALSTSSSAQYYSYAYAGGLVGSGPLNLSSGQNTFNQDRKSVV